MGSASVELERYLNIYDKKRQVQEAEATNAPIGWCKLVVTFKTKSYNHLSFSVETMSTPSTYILFPSWLTLIIT